MFQPRRGGVNEFRSTPPLKIPRTDEYLRGLVGTGVEGFKSIQQRARHQHSKRQNKKRREFIGMIYYIFLFAPPKNHISPRCM